MSERRASREATELTASREATEQTASREAAEPGPGGVMGAPGPTEPVVPDVPEDEHSGPVVRDKRRIDPETGQLRPGQPSRPVAPVAESAPVPASGAGGGDVAELTRQIAERTTDLQRLQAEYANYRRRVERDRELSRETAVANVLTNLLPVLDDIGRARDHGELEGGFKSVAEGLESIVEKLGLVRFGESGEPFDPTVHEALTHRHSADVVASTAVEVFQPGYRIGDRVLRPARVAVADPQTPTE